MKEAKDFVEFYGHPMITATHPTTLQITKDEWLTERGDCIVGIKANKACKDLNDGVRNAIKSPNSRILIKLIVDKEEFHIHGIGNPNLTLTHEHDIVLRKSAYICNRTLAIKCDYSARDLPRSMVNKLKDFHKKGLMVITVNY